MFRDETGVTNGGQRRCTDDQHLGWWNQIRGVARTAIADNDALTDMLLQQRHRGRSENDFVVRIDRMTGENWW